MSIKSEKAKEMIYDASPYRIYGVGEVTGAIDKWTAIHGVIQAESDARERAAREYVEEYLQDTCFMESGLSREESVGLGCDAYSAGSHSRQSEIDELTNLVASLQDEIFELQENPNSGQAAKIDELIEALEEAARWISVSERLPFYDKAPDRCETIPCLIKTTSRMLMVAYYDVKYECWNDDQDDDVLGYEVAFWRPIDTPKATQLLEKYGKITESVKPKE